jgi:hypothetical protein
VTFYSSLDKRTKRQPTKKEGSFVYLSQRITECFRIKEKQKKKLLKGDLNLFLLLVVVKRINEEVKENSVKKEGIEKSKKKLLKFLMVKGKK